MGIKNNNQPTMVIFFGRGRTWGERGQGGGGEWDAVDNNRDNNVTAGDGAVEAARNEEGDYDEMEDFANSSKGMVMEATQVKYPPSM